MLLSKSSGDMVDGFGGGLIFGLSDTGYDTTGLMDKLNLRKKMGNDPWPHLVFYNNSDFRPKSQNDYFWLGNVGLGRGCAGGEVGCQWEHKSGRW